MRLAVFDTNVLISAGIRSDSSPGLLLDDWILRSQVQVVTSPSIVAEYRDVFSRPKFRRYDFPPPWLEWLIEESLVLPDPPPWPLDLPDAKDACFLALAKSSGAWLVTGNLKHFPRKARRGVAVVSPSDYLAELEASAAR
jgi:uncharacterized protein